jgi:hypothetical protein
MSVSESFGGIGSADVPAALDGAGWLPFDESSNPDIDEQPANTPATMIAAVPRSAEILRMLTLAFLIWSEL